MVIVTEDVCNALAGAAGKKGIVAISGNIDAFCAIPGIGNAVGLVISPDVIDRCRPVGRITGLGRRFPQ